MSLRSASLLIEDIWEAIEKIERYIEGFNRESFLQDGKTIDSVVRNLEIIGEAANRLPETFLKNNKTVEWRKIIGLRNRIVHDYMGLDYDMIWYILHNDFPELKRQLKTIKL